MLFAKYVYAKDACLPYGCPLIALSNKCYYLCVSENNHLRWLYVVSLSDANR